MVGIVRMCVPVTIVPRKSACKKMLLGYIKGTFTYMWLLFTYIIGNVRRMKGLGENAHYSSWLQSKVFLARASLSLRCCYIWVKRM